MANKEVVSFVRQLGELVGTDDIGPSSSEEYKCDTCIRGERLRTWGEKAGDCGTHVANTEVVPFVRQLWELVRMEDRVLSMVGDRSHCSCNRTVSWE